MYAYSGLQKTIFFLTKTHPVKNNERLQIKNQRRSGIMCCSYFDLKGKEKAPPGGEKKGFLVNTLLWLESVNLNLNLPYVLGLSGIRKKSFGLVVLSNASLVFTRFDWLHTMVLEKWYIRNFRVAGAGIWCSWIKAANIFA